MIRTKIVRVMKLIDIQLTSMGDCHNLIGELSQDDEFDVENMEAVMATLGVMQDACNDIHSRCASLWLAVNEKKKALADVEEKAPF